MKSVKKLVRLALGTAIAASSLAMVSVATAPAAQAAQPVPGHTRLVPDVPRNNTPRISSGEIWDIEVIPSLNRVFIAGSFSSLQNTTGNTAVVNQPGLASYNYQTGQIDTSFRPSFGGGGVSTVEASPDGTKLFVGGTFNTVNGVARQKVASLNLTTGAPVTSFAFTASTNNQVSALEATNSTVYIGGRFSRVNGVLKTGLAAANATTGAIDAGFSNDLAGGIGVNGALAVQDLDLTHDDSKLLVVHTGRKIAGQDRLGMGIINTSTKQLLPWRSRLWDENLGRVGGVTRIFVGSIAPNDSYFVVASGSGGDAPPISDTVIAYPLTAASLNDDDVDELWISRHFDSIYSLAATENAVYAGGHFGFIESPTSNDPWPGLDNVGYGTGQGLGGYGLGDQVVRREHLAALSPATGKSLEWNSYATAFEGNKAMKAFPRGLFVGGDGQFKGGVRTGRVAFYDFNSLPAASTTDTVIETPIEGRVVPSGEQFTVTGRATNPQGIRRVQVEIQDRDSKQFLQDDGVSWGGSNNFYATLGTGTTNRTWSLPVTVTGNRNLQVMAKTFGTNGTNDATKAIKKIESFGLDDATPTTSITGPSGVQTSTTFTLTGTATDDKGVNRLSYWFRDENLNYLQNDGTSAPVFNSFSGTPDVIGATSATWSYEVTLPYEGIWRASATAYDTTGQADLRSAIRDFRVDSTASAPAVTVTAPASMTPPFAAPSVTVTPGQPVTFSGTATDDVSLKTVEVGLRNTSTGENLGNDGTWGVNVNAGNYRISPQNLSGTRYNWSYTTPFNLSPGTYSFTVRATDNEDLTTASGNQGRLTLNAQVPGDDPPNGTVTGGGTFTVTDPNVALAGTATDAQGVNRVELLVRDADTGRYLQDNGSYNSTYNTVNASLSASGPGATSVSWTYGLVLPGAGDFNVTAYAYDTANQRDPSTTGATTRYRYYPGDLPPGFNANLGQPVSGTAFSEGRIVVTGRAEDDLSIQRVEVGIVNAAGQYMSSAGTFTSTTPSYRAAFLNSPGSPASNFSYTTPVIPNGTYSVVVRAQDHRDQYSELRTSTGITVTSPANNPPVANGSRSCNQNVCSFDGRASSDENTSSLTYSWSYGDGTTGSGPVPQKTYTRAGTFTPTLTVRDEWNVSSAVFTLPAVTITEPAGNQPPTAVLLSNCLALACSTSSSGTTDPNAGDVLTYTWAWGDGTANSTGATATHTYANPGAYTISLTVTDGWGKATTVTKQVSLQEPASNQPPTVAWNATCTGLACTFSSTGTSDPNGDQIRYAWTFGDGTTSTAASPTKTYAAAGSYQVTLTVTDGWNRSAQLTKTVTVS